MGSSRGGGGKMGRHQVSWLGITGIPEHWAPKADRSFFSGWGKWEARIGGPFSTGYVFHDEIWNALPKPISNRLGGWCQMKTGAICFLAFLWGCCTGKVLVYPPQNVFCAENGFDLRLKCKTAYQKLKGLKVDVQRSAYADDKGKFWKLDWQKGELGTILLSIPFKEFKSWITGNGSIFLCVTYNGKKYEGSYSFKKLWKKVHGVNRGDEYFSRVIKDSGGVVLLNFWKITKK